MSIDNQFSRFAHEYTNHNDIQTKVVKHLLSKISTTPKQILDLGCGRGAVTQNIEWRYDALIAVDFAPKMLELHPTRSNITPIYGDFNNPELYEQLLTFGIEHVISSSSLQWSPDLNKTVRLISSLDVPCSFAIFTSNTFKTVQKITKTPPLLRSQNELKNIINNHFDARYETISYRLEFNNNLELFRYIKKSGVSGDRNLLSYTQTKRAIAEYPLSYLEFEVLFVHTR